LRPAARRATSRPPQRGSNYKRCTPEHAGLARRPGEPPNGKTRRLAYNVARMHHTSNAAACLLLSCCFATGALAAAENPPAFDLRVARGALPESARVLRVYKDDPVRLRITSEIAGSVHLHAYRLEAKLAPGVPAEMSFTARATGRFRVEWHPADDGARQDRHGPPLAVLEVRPR
jgi:hypothetical protein